MTAGQEALREAARLESARVYGGVNREHRQPISIMAAVAEAELTARSGAASPDVIRELVNAFVPVRVVSAASRTTEIEQAVARGWDAERISTELGVPVAEVDSVWSAMNAANGSASPSPVGQRRSR